MKKVLLALPIFLLFLAPVFAGTVDLTTQCNNGGGNYIVQVSDTVYQLSGDVACTVNIGTVGNFYRNMTIDLNGYTLTGQIIMFKSSVTGLEIKNGNIVGWMTLRVANSGTLSRFYAHDLTINNTAFPDAIYVTMPSNVPAQIDEMDMANLALTSNADIFGTTGTLYVKDSKFTCTGVGAVNTGETLVSNQVIGVQTYENDVQTGCTTDSYQLSGGNLNGGTTVILKNSSSISVEAPEFNGYSNTIIYEEPLTVNMQDQNSNAISGVGVVQQTAGDSSPVSARWNPTPHADVGVDTGIGQAYFAKNITSYGGFSSYPTYNLTVKSRGQSQSRLITFHSPSDQNFTFDFSAEDAGGGNVVVDNRTVPEKAGNAVTGVMAILSPLIMFVVPFLAVI